MTHDVLLLLIPYSLKHNQFGDEELQVLFDGIKNCEKVKELSKSRYYFLASRLPIALVFSL